MGGLVHRSECLGKTARAGLELDEVPAKLPRTFHCDVGKLLGRPLLAIGVAPGSDRRPVSYRHPERSLDSLPSQHSLEFKLDVLGAIEREAARLRAASEAKPMRLPVNRRVDESHHALTPDGLSVWYTIQVSPHSRIQEAIFERNDRAPTDAECLPWLERLIVGATASEAPGLPGALTRRFEAFERNPNLEAPIA